MLQRAFAAAAITAACVAIPAAAQAAAPLTSERPHGRSANQPARPRRRPPGARLDAQRRRPRPRAVRLPGRRHQGRPDGLGQRRGALARLGERAVRGPGARVGARKYAWKVRVWDETGKPQRLQRARAARDRPAQQSDWTAKWIGAPADDLNLSGDKWIWYTNDDATSNMPAMTRFLRTTVTLAERAEHGALPVHGRRRGRRLRQRHARRRHQGPPRQRQERLAEGQIVESRVALHGGREHDRRPGQEPPRRERRPATPARLHRPPARPTARRSTRQRLEVERHRPAGWQQPGFDDTAWHAGPRARRPTAPARGAPTSSLPRQPSPLAAQGLHGRASRSRPARLLRTALGLLRDPHQRREGRRPTSSRPGWTEYTKRVQYKIYDVTGLVSQGANAHRRRARRRLVLRPPRRAAASAARSPWYSPS